MKPNEQEQQQQQQQQEKQHQQQQQRSSELLDYYTYNTLHVDAEDPRDPLPSEFNTAQVHFLEVRQRDGEVP